MAIYATTRVAADTGGGTQDITFPEVDFTPASGDALVLLTVSQAITDDTEANHGVHCRGVTNGTAEAYVVITSQDGRATVSRTLARTRANTNACIVVVNGNSTVVGVASFDSWVSGGIRINWDTTPSAAYLISATIIAGSDVGCYIEHRNHDTAQDSAETFTTGLGSVTCGMILSTKGQFDGAIDNDAVMAFGYFDSSLNQTSRSYILVNSQGDTKPAVWVSDTRAIVTLQGYTGTPPQGEVTSVASGSVQVTKRGAATNFEMVLIALDLPADAWAGLITQPATTGTKVHSDPGFPAGMAIIDPSLFGPGLKNAIGQFTTSGLGALSAIDFYGNEYCTSFREEVTVVANFDSACRSDDRAINLPRHGGATGVQADYVGVDDNGFELDYTAIVGGGGQVCPTLALKALHQIAFGATQGSPSASFTLSQQAVQIGATQAAATGSLALSQQAAQFAATQASPSASADLAQLFRAVVDATQGSPTASVALKQLFQATFGATQGPAVADFALRLLFRSTFGATQGAATGVFSLSQQAVQFGVTQGSPTATADLVQLFRATFAAVQGSPTANFDLAQVARLAFEATQGSPSALASLTQLFRATFGAAQGAAVADFALQLHQRLTFGATQGAATGDFQLLTALTFQIDFAATQGSPSASFVASLVHRATFGATQGAATGTFSLSSQLVTFGATQGAATADFALQLHQRLSFGAAQGAATAAFVLLQIEDHALVFAATQASPQTQFILATPTDLISPSRTCLEGSYMRIATLAASRSVVSAFAADYDSRTDMAASRNARASMAATHSVRTDLAARKEACI